MLKNLLGSKSKEQVLLYLSARKEGYAREIAKYFYSSLSPIQNQLNKLETGGVLSSKLIGKTRMYYFNPRYPFLKELTLLLEKAFQFLSYEERDRLMLVRKRPRRKGKTM